MYIVGLVELVYCCVDEGIVGVVFVLGLEEGVSCGIVFLLDVVVFGLEGGCYCLWVVVYDLVVEVLLD